MENKLYRSRTDKKIAGVCGGLTKYLNLAIDSNIVRIIWAILAIGSFGTCLLIYLVCALIIPEEPNQIEG